MRISRRIVAGLGLFTACGEEPPAALQVERAAVEVVAAPPKAAPEAVTVAIDATMLNFPRIGIDIDGCAVDFDVPLVRLAEPIASLVIVAKPGEGGGDFDSADCSAPALFEVPREVLAIDPPRGLRGEARLRLRAEAGRLACDEAHSVAVCLRDHGGALHASLWEGRDQSGQRVHPYGDGWLNAPRLLTPSGPSDDTLRVMRGWQLVGADPSTGARARVEVRAVGAGMGPAVSLRLTTGEALRVPEKRELWHVERASWIRASEVVAGDRLFGLGGPVEVRETEAKKAERGWVDVVDVSAPDTYFIGNVLVRDGRPTVGEIVPLPAAEDPQYLDAVDFAAEAHSYDCALWTTITLQAWPEHAERVVLLAAAHPGPPGARVALACDAASEVVSIPRAVWEGWRAQPRTSDQPLTLSLEAGAIGWEAEDEDFAGVIGCSSDVALLSCARAADGTLSPIMQTARWGLSGSSCFATGTPIETPAGPVAIEALEAGTLVRSIDVVSGQARVARVQRVVSRGPRPALQLRLEDGRTLRVTGEHPLWLPRLGDFRPAGGLRVGDRLLGSEGAALRVDEVAPAGDIEVWELSVAAPDTYFAGGVLAHNY